MNKGIKKRALEQIRKNIETCGFHIYQLQPGPCPRCLYTIGLSKKIGFELVLAGTSYLEDENASELVQLISEALLKTKSKRSFLKRLGRQTIEFRITNVHTTWSEKLILGAADYYQSTTIKAMHVTIEDKFQTIDCADLSKPFDGAALSPWKWLACEWPFKIPDESTALTNLNALFGKQVTQIARWEKDTWAVFSGFTENQPHSRIREVALGTFLGIDPALEFITRMKRNDGYWRDRRKSEWQDWNP